MAEQFGFAMIGPSSIASSFTPATTSGIPSASCWSIGRWLSYLLPLSAERARARAGADREEAEIEPVAREPLRRRLLDPQRAAVAHVRAG